MKKINQSRLKIILSVVLAAVFFGAFAGCKKADGEKKEKTTASFAVNTYKITEGRLDDYLEFGGDIVASSLVNIMPDTNGKISRIMVRVGDLVKKDQIVAYIDPSRPGMTYSENPVKAPTTGTITLFPYSVGEMVGSSVSIGQISSTGNLEIHTDIAERFVSRIKKGQTAAISFDAFPGEVFSAHVFEVSPVLDTTTRTMKVKLSLDKVDPRIKVGMYSRIKLITEELENVITMPFDAIIVRDSKSYVFVVNRAEGKQTEKQIGVPAVVHSQEVTQGIHVDEKVEITSGLKPGDEVVIRGQTVLVDGANVNILNE
ncbi:efflux RND transporter periplasmic adaptor subunit [Treponema parvum]|uniref:efflux RND transporter periplasmic adaptor subunit n=1 Tax=Treponema parvum TaxID=138851 RepID=UPI001AEC1A5C|nr:efflux RND transporter periplasmic adaptor subunit [Treponema parvum]QTQ17146.1 efflux RND transporter periplasmic adaptor subunit [Treponema parvum]